MKFSISAKDGNVILEFGTPEEIVIFEMPPEGAVRLATIMKDLGTLMLKQKYSQIHTGQLTEIPAKQDVLQCLVGRVLSRISDLAATGR